MIDTMTLRILATGGTFDKHYNELNGTLGFADSHLPAALTRARLTVGVTLEQLPLMDSLDMVDADRARILAACQAASEKAIVIVHGTDTMPQPAAVYVAMNGQIFAWDNVQKNRVAGVFQPLLAAR